MQKKKESFSLWQGQEEEEEQEEGEGEEKERRKKIISQKGQINNWQTHLLFFSLSPSFRVSEPVFFFPED